MSVEFVSLGEYAFPRRAWERENTRSSIKDLEDEVQKNRHKVGFLFWLKNERLNYSALIFAARRLFLRAAMFLLIKPLVAYLSIIDCSVENVAVELA